MRRTIRDHTGALDTAMDGCRRVIVERVRPAIDGGRFPIKRTPGEQVDVLADIFADGHDRLAGVLKYRAIVAPPASPSPPSPLAPAAAGASGAADDGGWREETLAVHDGDTWRAAFTVTGPGVCEYMVEAWIDRFGTWLRALLAKAGDGQDVSVVLLEGARLVEDAARLAAVPSPPGDDGAGLDRHEADRQLLAFAHDLRDDRPQAARVATAQSPRLLALMRTRPDRRLSTASARFRVVVDPERARAGAWYELFPRSCTPDPARSGTFRDAEAELPRIAAMGFDVLYLPPIHPIGRTHRKGRNGAPAAAPDDTGSPWAIGAREGGHTAIEPGLGTIDDFDRFVAAAGRLGLQIALDIAFQASPDHPWVSSHPEWFAHRADGSIAYAENPPKRYQDIYPLNFESPDWAALWTALAEVFLYWAAHGVRIFRVDNPHTKSFRFWEWCIAEVKRRHPDAIFLSEAFTRPAVMQYLAKAGFTQSYTYYTWRNTADELRTYLTELTTTEVHEYLRPNFFANTPDILHEYLQHGGRPAFEVRLVLAATLAASYGIYSGYELCERTAVRPGSEEYLDSEKYQIRVRDWNQPGTLQPLITRINAIRRAHPALQFNDGLRFHAATTPALLWFSKHRGDDRVFVAANTDPHHLQHGWVEMPLDELGLDDGTPFVVHDLLDGRAYTWQGRWNYVRLDPSERMAHVFVIRTR